MTTVLALDPLHPDPAILERAANVIRGSGLVAFPTETVYGLGANALDMQAVARIFVAKGRPATNPVIVHVAEAADALRVAAEWPESAAKLAARFWPGPLTLVLPRRAEVPDVVTAGGPTVAVRCPAHLVAAGLIRAAGTPLAAPSANRSTELSPTRAEHVLKSLAGRIDLILDGGPCVGGIESTVLDLTTSTPRLLRPGLVSVPMIEAIVGPVAVGGDDSAIARSPGQMAKHYAPRAELHLLESNADAPGPVSANSAWLAFGPSEGAIAMPTDSDAYAARLYEVLHSLDDAGVAIIHVTLPPMTPEWAGVHDRLRRAATSS